MIQSIILGTMAIDTIQTPFGRAKDALGGSATYAAYAASFFSKPGIISVIGNDFPQNGLDMLLERGVDLKGVKKEGKTFRWDGFYEYDMNDAKTLKTELNSLASFKPEIPEDYKNAQYVFLGNIDPAIQLEVIESLKSPKVIVTDTMNFWITSRKDELLKVIAKTDIFVINDGEARLLFNTTNLVKAAANALKLGPKSVIIKKGEHGSLLFTHEKHFNAPGYPLENIKDPTGCGDTFGGSLIGYLSMTGSVEESNIRKAIVYGSAIASFNAEDFSLNMLRRICMNDIKNRFDKLKEIREF